MGKKATFDLPDDQFSTEAPTKKSTRFLEWAGAKVDPNTGEVTPKAKPKRRATMAAGVFTRALAETNAMMLTGDWSTCAARHLVALYDLMHKKVYGIEPVMSSSERHIAVVRSAAFVNREFSGDYEKVIDYFRWIWTREIGREKWRRENNRDGQRLMVGTCISGTMITDYRLALTRQRR